MLMGMDLRPRGPKKNKGKAKALDHLKPNGTVEKKKGKGEMFLLWKEGSLEERLQILESQGS